jgi:hypothetical protein
MFWSNLGTLNNNCAGGCDGHPLAGVGLGESARNFDNVRNTYGFTISITNHACKVVCQGCVRVCDHRCQSCHVLLTQIVFFVANLSSCDPNCQRRQLMVMRYDVQCSVFF